ncbi:aldo/keto reductase [Paenibacillus sp. F6_3S_P_1C]|uniref:Aldo/keto reductase n=1 Tax=Paenibacillus vandeheii TaxID=3035917 RepID=A0ABT8JC86_9BACL|nr:aldo/keto reductase [Paenibacillus vandeheii]MDN4602117.1 aldo/keto reductase [Paenibacillus vandeheii]
MKMREIGDLKVSEMGMGCMGFSHGYGAVPEESYSISAIHQAYNVGCTFFDTAEGYGRQMFDMGHNERLVGKALEPFRKDVVLATKLHIDTKEPEKDGSLYHTVKRHLIASMDKLRTDYIDLYYLHRVNPDIPVEDVAECMGRLIKEGLIRGWGVSQLSAKTMMRAHAVTPLTAVQSIYSMMERNFEKDIIPLCEENKIGFVAFSPIASGYLSGKVNVDTKFEGDDVRKWVPQMKKENIIANKPLLEIISDVASRKGATNAQISLAWMLHKYPHVVPIPGSKNKERILENLEACNVSLTEAEFCDLEMALNQVTVHGQRSEIEELL